jgi:hypothetical protein
VRHQRAGYTEDRLKNLRGLGTSAEDNSIARNGAELVGKCNPRCKSSLRVADCQIRDVRIHFDAKVRSIEQLPQQFLLELLCREHITIPADSHVKLLAFTILRQILIDLISHLFSPCHYALVLKFCKTLISRLKAFQIFIKA